MLRTRLPAAFHAVAGVGLGVAMAMHILAGSPLLSIVLFAVSACMNVGLACWHLTARERWPVAARARRDIRRSTPASGPPASGR